MHQKYHYSLKSHPIYIVKRDLNLRILEFQRKYGVQTLF